MHNGGARAIPFSTTLRADTGLYNAKLGMFLFLASEAMFFGALFSSYVFLRTGSLSWQGGTDTLGLSLGIANTLLLVSSSVSMARARSLLGIGNFKGFRHCLGLTLLLGMAFLLVKGVDYGTKFHQELFPRENTFLAIYFTLTGIHAVHVFGGLLFNAYLFISGSKLRDADPQRLMNRVEIAGWYWHFVDAIWLCMFSILYLW